MLERASFVVVSSLLLGGGIAVGQPLEVVATAPLAAETVQEVDFLPGNASNPAGWAVVGRTEGVGGVRGLTFLHLGTMASCDLALGKNVQDVVVFEGKIYAALRRSGSADVGFVVLDPAGGDPCAISAGEPAAPPLANASNLRVGRVFGQPHAVVANSFLMRPCDAGYQGDDLAVFLYDVSATPPSFVARWTPGQDGSGFQRACDPCGVLCAPEDVVIWSGATTRWMAVASLLDGVWLVDVTDPLNPVAAAHFLYQFEGRNRAGDPVPDVGNLTGDIEVTPDGRYLVTSDQSGLGGHVLVWDVQEILSECGDAASPCGPGDLQPVGELFPDGPPPGFAHKLLADWPFLWVTWFDPGVYLLDMSDPTAPRELAVHDVLDQHPGDSFNQWGAYGAALARPCDTARKPSDLIVSDIGIWESASVPDQPGGIEVLRWNGISTVVGPLLLSKDPADPANLFADWSPAPLTAGYRIYAGSVPAPPSDHTVPPTQPALCDAPCCRVGVAATPGERLEYFLLRTRNACGDLGALSEGRLDPEPTICD